MTNESLLEEAFAIAWAEALQAHGENEVPVGSAVIHNGELIASAHNRIVQENNPTAHAELSAIALACKAAGSERLPGAILVSTLEPCVMCSGAALLARFAEVHVLALDDKLPALRRVLGMEGHNHRLSVIPHERKEYPSSDLLRAFFQARRKK